MPNIMDVTAVVGLLPLPGTYSGRNTRFRDVISDAVCQCRELYETGIRSIMLQNVNDSPAYVSAPNYIIAYMTAVCTAVRDAIPGDCRLGVSILRNDTPGAIAVADASGMDFVRAKVLVGAMMKMEMEPGNLNETLEMKLRLRNESEIWADVHDRNGAPVFSPGLEADCGYGLRSGADALILSGATAEDTALLLKRIKQCFPKARLIIGGGADSENIGMLMQHADGVIVASSIKVNGKLSNPIDPVRTEAFITAFLNAGR